MAVIFFDTNILYADIDNERYDVIRAIARTEHRVCIPKVVRDELVAKKVLAHRKDYAALKSAAAKVAKGAPWMQAPAAPPAYDEGAARGYWTRVYASVFEIVPTPSGAADLALEREAFCDKPAKPDENKKGGARDVALWLTLMHPWSRTRARTSTSSATTQGTSVAVTLSCGSTMSACTGPSWWGA